MLRKEKDSASRMYSPGTGWIDITVPLRSNMVHWPDDPPVSIKRIADVSRGDGHTLSEIAMSAHSGTHMDAPLHFLKDGAGIDRLPLDKVIGKARVIQIEDRESVKLEALVSMHISRGERILFKTLNSAKVWQSEIFEKDFVYISKESAEFLAERKVALVGIDYLSVGAFREGGSEVHKTLLGAGIWIIEGLDLSAITPGEYELICLPLRITGGDGAPARAILRHLPKEDYPD